MDSWFQTRRKPRRVGPSVEKLEDRALLSTTPVLHSFPYPVGYEPEQIRGAYGISAIHLGRASVDGAGQTIAIVVAGNDPVLLHDVNAFDKAFAIGPSGPTLFKKYGADRTFLTVFNQSGKVIDPRRATSPATAPPQPTEKSPARGITRRRVGARRRAGRADRRDRMPLNEPARPLRRGEDGRATARRVGRVDEL